MAYRLDDTICAAATARGGAARGIVRVSGPEALAIVESLRDDGGDVPLLALSTATCVAGQLAIEGTVTRLPCEMYCWPGAHSFTREPVVELHTLGSPPLIEAVVQSLCRGGARLAEPGEFTLRAFLAGRLDLTQAEAVLGVIDARSDRQLSAALAQLAGGMSGPLHELRETLLNALADLEAGLDFTEEDIAFISAAELAARIDGARREICDLVEQLRRRSVSDVVPRVALVGWPNVGKSSLYNALTGRESAIVADQQGTTRDFLTAELDCAGMKCRLVDTAGLDPSGTVDEIGRMSQRLAGSQHESADVQLFCVDASRPLNSWERGELARRPLAALDRILVATKSDCGNAVGELEGCIRTSSHTGGGLDTLRAEMARVLQAQVADATAVSGTAERCQDRLETALNALERGHALVMAEIGDECVAVELRRALDAIGEVVGTVYTDDVLGRIFSRFCIGK